MVALRERDNLEYKERPMKIDVGGMVMVKGEYKNRRVGELVLLNKYFMEKIK